MGNKKISLGIFVFLFFAGLYAFFSIGHYGGDGYEDYLTAESIVLDRDIDLYDRPDDPDDLAYGEKRGIEGKDGNVYSSRGALGVPVLLSLFYAAGHVVSFVVRQVPHDLITMLAASFYNPMVSAAGVLLVFLVARRLDLKDTTSLAAAFIYGLATMAPVYTRTGFTEPTFVMFLLLSVYWLLCYRQDAGLKWMVFSALAASYCVLVKVTGLIYIPVLFLYAAWISAEKDRKVLPVVTFAVVVSACVALILAYNFTIYGKFLNFGGYNLAGGAKHILRTPRFLKGLYYYLFSSGKSLFIYNLPVILALSVIPGAMREKKKTPILFLALVLVNLLFSAKIFTRGSLFSWGPRYLFPSVPLLVLLAGYYIENMRTFIAKAAVWLLSIAGFFIMLPCMFISQSKFYHFVVEKLKLEEYMINFIPDLSPIKGAWWLIASNIAQWFGKGPINFVYSPDFRLVEPVSASLAGYDNASLWFLKVAQVSPACMPAVWAGLGALAFVVIFSAWKIFEAK